jgi:hypothetical protein
MKRESWWASGCDGRGWCVAVDDGELREAIEQARLAELRCERTRVRDQPSGALQITSATASEKRSRELVPNAGEVGAHPRAGRTRLGIFKVCDGIVVPTERLREQPEMARKWQVDARAKRTEPRNLLNARKQRVVQPIGQPRVTGEMAGVGQRRETPWFLERGERRMRVDRLELSLGALPVARPPMESSDHHLTDAAAERMTH